MLCAHPGNGTGQHLALELFAATAGIKVQSVPYRGSPQAATDLLGKRFDAFMDNIDWAHVAQLHQAHAPGQRESELEVWRAIR